MAASIALTVRDEQQTSVRERWEIQYSRFFSYLLPSSSRPSSLSPIQRNHFKGPWLSSSAAPTAILSLFADPSFHGKILTVTFQGKILEQHYVSKLHFSWPQLSCRPDVPRRGSQAVVVSYKDGVSETQKFGLRFSTYHEVRKFVTVLEDSFSNKQDSGDFMTTRSSRAKDMLSEVTPTGAFHEILEMHPLVSKPPKRLQLKEEEQSHSTDKAAIHVSEGYLPEFPPRFTSLLTNCSEMAQGDISASAATSFQEADLKSLIARCMQDTSFLDILTKVEDMIAEMGGGMTIQQFL